MLTEQGLGLLLGAGTLTELLLVLLSVSGDLLGKVGLHVLALLVGHVLGEWGRLAGERRGLTVVNVIVSTVIVLELREVVLGGVEDLTGQLLGLLSQTEGLLSSLLVVGRVLGVGTLLDDLPDLVLNLSQLLELLLTLLVDLTLDGASGLLLTELRELDSLLDHLARLVGLIKDQLGDLAGELGVVNTLSLLLLERAVDLLQVLLDSV